MRVVADTIDKIISLYTTLSSADKKRVRQILQGTRKKYNKGYDTIIEKVSNHLLKHGSITSREAYEHSYTTEELHATTFRRCVIEKLTFKVIKKSLRDRRACYCLPGVGYAEGNEGPFDEINEELVLLIVNSVDLSGESVNLTSVLDDVLTYPILGEAGNLVKVTPLLINEMAKRNWDMISPNLDFVKRVE
jgi:hypothetical protein